MRRMQLSWILASVAVLFGFGLFASGNATSAPTSKSSPSKNSAKAPAKKSAKKPRPLPAPPVAEKIPHEQTVNGHKLVDDYFWMRDRNDPRVMAYLKAENDYTDAMMKPLARLEEKIYNEIVSRIKQTDLSVPVRWGPYLYYTRTVEGQQYAIHCRKKGSLEAAEEILLDENEVAKGESFFQLGAFEVSPDHQRLAYTVDTTGDERYRLAIRDLKDGKTLSDTAAGLDAIQWANDNRTLFYTTRDKANRPYRLYRHALGEPAEKDSLVFEEPNDAFNLGVSKTNSDKFVLLSLGSNTTSEVHLIDADHPAEKPRLVRARKPKVQYSVEHHGDSLYIVTNEDAVNFKLMTVPVADPGAAWKEMIPNRADVKLEGIEPFARFLVIQERTQGVPTLRVRNIGDGETHTIELPEKDYSLDLASNPEFDTEQLRFIYTSFVTPHSVFDYDMAIRTRELKKEQVVLGGYDRKLYVSERIHATAKDGTKIPISLVYHKGLVRDGKAPCLLDGYGAYGISEDPAFSSGRLSLLDRGFVFALAHIRGGGEMGRPWYEAGKLENKPNTFTDFIACAEHLVAEKYTSPARLAAAGGSAGGLLMGAVANQRPELFHAVIADVPFVDVLNSMLDATLPLTVGEYEEWGNPQEPKYFDLIRSYAPYENIRPQAYPHLLVLAGLNDTRVAYWEPAKWVAKLRATKTDKHWLLLRTNLTAGHGGPSGRYEHIKEIAFQYTFLINRLGVK